MIVFFGVGRIGRRCLSFGKECGLNVDYLTDNNESLWGKWIEDVEVIPPAELVRLPEDTNIIITCKDSEPIFVQLRKLGIHDHQVKRCNTFVAMLEVVTESSSCWLPLDIPRNIEASSILFCLDSGLTLGGVELWSLDTAKELRKLGWETSLLLNCETQTAMDECENEYMIKAICSEDATEREKLIYLAGHMLRYRNIICNFPGYNLMAACLIKKLFPTRYRVVTAIHGDEEVYYQSYMEAEPYLDKCLIISSKMYAEMIKRGFPKGKLVYLLWKIPCNEVFFHQYSIWNEPLCIGYAGRVVVDPKRVDLLLTVAQKLEERDLDFRMEIAGTGDYEEELRRQIQTAGLEDKVRCLGMQRDMDSFWARQDVMITCSEHEGHSISQCEAMAAGAVPVITDTSGARDDVEDGKNGFVVAVGGIDQMVEKLCFLYFHRDELPILGERAHRTILERSRSFDFQKLWEGLLIR